MSTDANSKPDAPADSTAARPVPSGHLTRYGMEQVIKGGRPLSFGGRIITTIEDLPTDAEIEDQRRRGRL